MACLLTLVAMGFNHWHSRIMLAYTNPALLEFLAGAIIAYLWMLKSLRLNLSRRSASSQLALHCFSPDLFYWTASDRRQSYSSGMLERLNPIPG